MIANGFILAKVFNRISIKTLLDHSAGRPTPAQPCNQGDLRGTRDWSSAAPPPADALGEISAHSRAPPVAAQTSVTASAGKGGDGRRGSRTQWQIMLLTITTTADNASDLGFLLHKHPGRVQAFDVSVGTAHVFYPQVGDARTTAALLLEVDPIGLVRGRQGPASEGFALGQYVNDRPYAASSMLAVAIKEVFRPALPGRCASHQALADSALPLELHVPALPCRGGIDLARRVFEPLGWQVAATAGPRDPTIPDWGGARSLALRLAGPVRLADALNHLYVLLPVLDDGKHYWVATDEVDKLVRAGGDWLGGHPGKELITRRYLAHKRELTRDALARLAEVDDAVPEDLDNALEGARVVAEPDQPAPPSEQRRGAVLAVVRAAGARRVGDFGCGEGVLVRDLLADHVIERVVATDVSARALGIAARRLRLDSMSGPARARLAIFP